MFDNIHKIVKEVAYQASAKADEAIRYSLPDMEDFNAEQMLSGIDADGNEIRPEYRSDDYAQFKQSINRRPAFGTPDLRLTGSFQSGLFAKYDGNNVVFGSTDSKASGLEAKYGSSIFGLTDENKEDVKNGIIFPRFLQWLSGLINKL